MKYKLNGPAILLAAALASATQYSDAALVKALSFAINEAWNTGDKTPIQNYMGTNDVDFGVFDFGKANTYFVNADFTSEGRNFAASYYQAGKNNFKFILYNSDKYTLENTPLDDMSGENMAAVFRDANGDLFALLSVRGTYKDDKVSATLGPVKTYVEGIAAKYPGAKIIVTYNARLTGTYATTGNTYPDILNTYLTQTASGPQMTCLGRTSTNGASVGGAYMYPADLPLSYSAGLVPKSIGTMYDGTLVTLTYPIKYKVIFNDWDGTGLQTNVVFAGESVTPPVPQRSGYTFTGWDHAASEFASVTASFTATAQYALNAASLRVVGDPENLGTADPAYGSTSAIAAGDQFTASVTMPALAVGATSRWVCAGYTHYEITDVVTGAKTIAQEGNAASFAYEHVFHDELEWHFTNEWLVSVSSTAGGSVSAAAETWVRNGETISLVATPGEGYDFWRWDGDTDGIADVSAASISPTITAARTLRAVFAPAGADVSVQYVATTGDDAHDGYSAESPKLTIQAAVDTLAALPGYGTVHVAPGLYQTSSSESVAVTDAVKANVAVTNAIAIIGDTGKPEDVIVRNTSSFNNAQVIVLYLNHPEALAANLTLESAHRNAPLSGPFGGNVAIDSAGGIVSNCIIRNALWYGNYGRGIGAWLNSNAALLTHCVITNNTASGNGYQTTIGGGMGLYGGLFVHVDKGTVANCLIANNRDTSGWSIGGQDKQSWSSGVTIRDGSLLNCTVVTNEARYTGGVYLHPDGYAKNVVVAGCVNRCSYTNSLGQIGWSDIGFKGTLANASHCASDGGEALGTTCIAGTVMSFFRDFEARDYRPAANSPLINKGATYGGLAVLDLLGKPRFLEKAPDIGCYEVRGAFTVIMVK
jgi:hypothetical protein